MAEEQQSRMKQLRTASRSLNLNPRIKIDTSKTQYAVVRQAAEIFQWKRWSKEQQKSQSHVIWVDTYVSEEQIKKLLPYQRINHFPKSCELGRKDDLARNLLKFKKHWPEEYTFFPQTWILPEQKDKFIRETKKQSDSANECYIAKPKASCQGRGIFLFQSPDRLIDTQGEYVVQRYLSDVFLIDGLKFDLRLYVLVTSLNPLRVYLYRQGLTRLATNQYQPPNPINRNNLLMHLTNYAINKTNPNFLFNTSEDNDGQGHKRSYTSLLQKLKQEGKNVEKLEYEIQDLIVKTIIACHYPMMESYKKCRVGINENEETYMTQSQALPLNQPSVCFQILGQSNILRSFDIIIDASMKPYLIEVNHTPSFVTDTPLDLTIKKHLIVDTLNLLDVSEDDRKLFLLNRSLRDTASRELEQQIKSLRRVRQEKYDDEQRLGGYRKIYPSKNIEQMQVLDRLLESGIVVHKDKARIFQPIKQPAKNMIVESPHSQVSYVLKFKGQSGHRRTQSHNERKPLKNPHENTPLLLPICKINPQLSSQFGFPLTYRQPQNNLYAKLQKYSRKNEDKSKVDVLDSNNLGMLTMHNKWLDLELTTENTHKVHEPQESHKKSMEMIEKSNIRQKIKMESQGLILNVTQTFYKKSPFRTSIPIVGGNRIKPFRMIIAQGKFELDELSPVPHKK